MSDDFLVFKDEMPADETEIGVPPEPWTILIVDDDDDVHDATVFALRDVLIQERPIRFLHAWSGRETIEALRADPAIALILLDAVMETEDAGLATVRVIREELKLEDVRIILRTGQPGQIPEIETITRYDINDYKTKSELTRTKLLTAVIAALRAWEQLRRIGSGRRGLEKIVEASNQFIQEQGLESFAEGVITQMAGFCDLEPEGIVCVSDAGENQCIIAAAGRYRDLINRRIGEIENREIFDAVYVALNARKTQIRRHSITVYFEEPSGRRYAIWIGSSAPIRDVNTRILEVFCTNISLCASNIELVNRLKRQAWEDPALKIPNMTALLDQLDAGIYGERECPECLVLLDIDGFNQINELLGHAYGDEILKSVALRLREILGNEAFIARVAADEFGILCCERMVSPEALRSLSTMTVRAQGAERELSLSVSVTPVEKGGIDASTHLRNGFIALKGAKAEGTGQIVRYSPAIGNATRERVRLLHELRGAFAENKLFLAFQPQQDMASGEVYSLEALLRWRNDLGEFIPPDKFIPLAEQAGLMSAMGTWVLRTALLALKEIHDAGFPGISMAVNVSAMQFRNSGFLSTLDAAISFADVDPSFLELELTESIAILGIEGVLKLLGAIRERGISLAIDDFGTGYSSLSSIDHWPVNRIKIDKSFVQQMDGQEEGSRIVDLVIPLAARLSLRVLAEGVETERQYRHLYELGCHEMQGYFLARPMPLAELLPWLKARGSVGIRREKPGRNR